MTAHPYAVAATVFDRLGPPPGAESSQLLQRLGVAPAHCALRGLRSPEPGVCAAWLRPQQPLDAETGPLAAAEVGRYLSILGAVAAASLNQDREHPYLACAGHLERICGTFPARARALVATARARLDGPRGALAHCTLRTPSGVVTHRMSFVYTRSAAGAAACPSVLIAPLMHELASLAGRLLRQRLGDPGAAYAITRAEVRVASSAVAGDELLLRAEHACDRADEMGVRCHAALPDGTPAGAIDLWLTTAAALSGSRSPV